MPPPARCSEAPGFRRFPRHTHAQVIAIARASPKISDWLSRYGTTTTIVDEDAAAQRFTVHFDAGSHGEVAQAVVDDTTGQVVAAWTGPQVAWTMARGYHYAFGRRINDPWIWLSLCAVFLVGLVDFRRLLSWRTLDLLVLLAPSISLAYFNQGLVFWSVPLVYPPLVYLLCRLVFIGVRSERRPAFAGSLPLWVLAGAAIFLIGFRGGLDRYDSNVIDVGYAGVVGADRLISGDTPYGTFPTRVGAACGIRYSDGTSQAYLQPQRGNRCESPIELGDTYGPINYAAYVPAVAITGWTGLWDDLPAAHLTSVVFDALCALGLLFAGRRLAGWRLGVALAFAWAAYPFTAFALESNTNDMIVTAFAIWGFVWATTPVARTALLSLAAWTKFAPLALGPLWLRYPRDPRPELAEWTYGEDPGPLPRRGRRERLREALWLGPRAQTRCSRWPGSSSARFPPRSCSCRATWTPSAPSGTPRSATSSTGHRRSRCGTGGSTRACPTCAGSRPCCRSRSRSGRSLACGCRGGSTPCGSPRSPARS